MTNEQIEQYRKILANAPDGATHCEKLASFTYWDLKTFCVFSWDDGRWEEQYAGIRPTKFFQSLDDIRIIVEQHDEIQRLRALINSHNEECKALCQPEQCGYAAYKRDCPNCPKRDLIDMELKQ